MSNEDIECAEKKKTPCLRDTLRLDHIADVLSND